MESFFSFGHSLFFFLVVLSILIFFHELGHFLAARFLGIRVLKFSLGFGPKVFGKKVGDTEYIVSALPLGGYVKMFGEEPEEVLAEGEAPAEAAEGDSEDPRPLTAEDRACSFSHQPVWKRIIVVVAGPAFNMLLAYLIFAGALAGGMGMYVPDFESLMPKVEQVVEGSPAEAAGILPGDRIVSIEGKKISTWAEMVATIYESAGKPLSFVVERGRDSINLKIIPAPKEIEGEDGKMITVGQIGIGKNPRGVEIKAAGIGEAAVKGFHATWAWTYLTVEGLMRLVTGKLGLDNIGGPILIGQLSGQAAEQGMQGLFFLIALLSITLGIMNILPIPVLDGGHLMFFLIEGVLGKPLSIRKREIAQQVGLVMLLLLMSLAFYNDIVRLIVGQ